MVRISRAGISINSSEFILTNLCVGLTGGIASGKSTVAEHFIGHGVPVIDADQVARDVVAPGTSGLAEVIAFFGPDYLMPDGHLDRRKLRERVFTQPEQRQKLEAMLHPRIKQSLRDWRDSLTAPYGILMAPILREGGFDVLTDRILVVDADRATQKSRLVARDHIDASLAEHMLNAQTDRASRLAIADDVIDNSGHPDALARRVEELHQHYLSLAQGAPI
jgi:dephospho-CoA kinase